MKRRGGIERAYGCIGFRGERNSGKPYEAKKKSEHTQNPIGLRFLNSQENGESGRPDVFLKKEYGGRFRSVRSSELEKTQGSNSVRFREVRFLVDEVPLRAPPRRFWLSREGEINTAITTNTAATECDLK